MELYIEKAKNSFIEKLFCIIYNNINDITYTVGTYSPGKLSVVYDINMQVFPTVPSPTTTHFIGLPELMIYYLKKKINIISINN